MNIKNKYRVIIIGGGHAGIEAALAASRMITVRENGDVSGVLLLTLDIEKIGLMSCNPAIGGIAKGQIVREIDALGGEMGKITDATGINFKILNRSKGPAVHSPRAQCDRRLYTLTARKIVENQKNLKVVQKEVAEILVDKNQVKGVVTTDGDIFYSDAVIITTGTFLNGLIHIGLRNFPAGRYNEPPSVYLSNSLRKLGFELGRLKTGTPPRLDKNSINFYSLEIQEGDNPPTPFSHFTDTKKWKLLPQLPCWITYTNNSTHTVIKNNLDRSPLYTKVIKGIGPRYCPSIEDKVVKFPDRDRHQVFLEPDGLNTNEIYCNGISTSLPEDVQEKIVHSLPGCENAKILRYGYAIEYDFCPPTQVKHTLETKLVEGLYFAGQINGTTGYEEAAGQGIVAGINAVLKLYNEEPFILRRDEAYIGVLIDDLVTKGVMDPYRMFTSRAEFRLLLRTDNADLRLMDYGHKFGIISEDVYKEFCMYRDTVNKVVQLAEKVNAYGATNTIAQLIRQGVECDTEIMRVIQEYTSFIAKEHSYWDEKKVLNEVKIIVKYSGYIAREIVEVEKLKKYELKKLPEEIDYDKIPGLLKEARTKLKDIRPTSIGQAMRISGVTPADISILLVYLKKLGYSQTINEK